MTSRGDANCNIEGISSRVSAILDWVTTCINGGDCSAVVAQTCDQCAQSSISLGAGLMMTMAAPARRAASGRPAAG